MNAVRRLLAAIPACAALIACSPAGPTADPSLPNVVFVTLDTTRADHLGLYGYFRDTSPRLDAFADQAIVFDDAIAPMATTLPTHTSLFTGTEPLEHGVLANLGHGGKRFTPSPTLRTFASVAREAGYATAAFVSSAPLKRNSGIEAGFETFEQPEGNATVRMGNVTMDAALHWLADASEPFLLWVHTYDAHWPFVVPEDFVHPFDQQAELAAWMHERHVSEMSVREGVGPEEALPTIERYDTAVHFQDAQLGRLLDALSARPDWERTVVVILADHGEGLSQHDHAAHGGTWNEHLRVPLLMRFPGEAPRRVPGTLSVTDVLATLIPRLGVPAFESLLAQTSGRDALAPDAAPRPVVSQDTGRHLEQPGYRFALTTPHWKYIETVEGKEQLYDRSTDPYELRDVSGSHPEVAGELRALLAAARSAQQERGASLRAGETPPPQQADPELIRQLCALGYVDDSCEAPEKEQ